MSEALPTLKELNVAAVGISPDSPKRQKNFDLKYNLGFPLLSDEDRAVADAFGVLSVKTVKGVKKPAIIRSSFLIDESGRITWRCPAERIDAFVAKGGLAADTEGRKCLCNGLLANIGLPQVRDGNPEVPIVTCGDDVANTLQQLTSRSPAETYTAEDVIDYLLQSVSIERAAT